MRVTLASLALLTAFAAPTTAHASPLLDYFTLTGYGTTITFEAPANPVPAGYLEGGYFYIDVTATLANGSTVPEVVGFSTAAFGGGINDSFLQLDVFGPQYFTGDVSDPTFIPGDYTLQHSVGTLDITPVPEPSPLILLGSGLLFVAGGLRWRAGRIKRQAKQAA
jgi:hypothetical protein